MCIHKCIHACYTHMYVYTCALTLICIYLTLICAKMHYGSTYVDHRTHMHKRIHCNTLQLTATHCNHTATTHCITLQRTNVSLHHTTTHCNTLPTHVQSHVCTHLCYHCAKMHYGGPYVDHVSRILFIYTHVCLHSCSHSYVYTHFHVYTHVYTHVLCVYTCVHSCVLALALMFIHTCIPGLLSLHSDTL